MPVTSILFVCAGNICRSPIAEELFKTIAQLRPRLRAIQVSSAGTIAMPGSRALRETCQVAQEELGLDLTEHRSRNVEGLTADLILTLDRRVTRQIERLGIAGRVIMLGDFSGDGEGVDDPYGSVLAAHRACARHIEQLIHAAADRLEGELATAG